ncbi:hypothetical protein ETB97_009897 [Aspergillus alliaceus]|uniref:Beta-lactamase/transpeptidase-like protein n=1 Tax=Petromyces alliaceus TaxID=209559 RepID=A0A8H6AGB7_PETAA|nr:hypothetical protein ETB97_009897 [Aspergillus burnettii]
MVQRQDSTPFTPQFDSLVQEQLEKWKVPGVTISVVHGSSTYAKAYGFAVLPDKEMTLDSLFTTCSTTKAFTAAAVSMAIDDSIKSPSPLTWDTPIASLIRDDFVLADDHATVNTTLEDALSHRSGLPGHIYAMVGAYPDESLRDAVRKLRHLPLAYPPRTTFDYCNHMFMVVSHVLEKIAGEPLGEILKKRIWDPLNMKDTYFSVQDVKRCPSTSPRLVQGYTWVPEKGSYVAEPHMNYAPTTGTGAIVSNVLDYAKWLRALIYQAGPISREGHAAVVQPRSVISNDEQDTVYPPAPYHLYALGWHSGYGVITLRVENGHLYSDLSDRVEAMTIQLEHAVGEFFVAKISTHSLSQCFKAEFYVDSTATARKVGMELEPALGDKMIWFERCL